jgi:hypothetical protein
LHGHDEGHQLTINLLPTDFITQAVVGFANITINNKTVSGLCSLQFAINQQTTPVFNANANCSSQAYEHASLGKTMARWSAFTRGNRSYINGLTFGYYV